MFLEISHHPIVVVDYFPITALHTVRAVHTVLGEVCWLKKKSDATAELPFMKFAQDMCPYVHY